MATFSLPSNVEAERSVLGAMLMDSKPHILVFSGLTENDFSGVDKRNKIIFKAMRTIYDNGDPIDAQTVTDFLINKKQLDDAGGTDYLYELLNSSITFDNVDHYIKIIRDQAILRNFLLKLNDIQNQYAEGQITKVSDFLNDNLATLSEISKNTSVEGFKDSKTVARAANMEIERESKSDRKGLTGVNTGYKLLNECTHGWHADQLIVIAARPSVGKTSLALNLCLNAANDRNGTVGFFSCEMSSEDCMKRLISRESMVPFDKLQTGYISERDKTKIASAVDTLSRVHLWIDDTPRPKIGDMVNKATILKEQHPDLCLIAVDYIGLIESSRAYDSRVNEVAEVTRTLRELARTIHVPIIALAQLNRNVDDFGGKPKLSNLRESGSIEQDADIVILMYREDYHDNVITASKKQRGYGNQPLPQQDAALQQQQAKMAESGISIVHCDVAKNRHGQQADIKLVFDKNHHRFDNYHKEGDYGSSTPNNAGNQESEIPDEFE